MSNAASLNKGTRPDAMWAAVRSLTAALKEE
jgi:hypothetical protein